MSPLDALWHLLNLFAPALLVGSGTAVMARWFWRHELRGMGLRRMLVWSVAPAMVATVGGLVVSGQDGRMVTYLAMVAACALGLWWRCFVRKR